MAFGIIYLIFIVFVAEKQQFFYQFRIIHFRTIFCSIVFTTNFPESNSTFLQRTGTLSTLGTLLALSLNQMWSRVQLAHYQFEWVALSIHLIIIRSRNCVNCGDKWLCFYCASIKPFSLVDATTPVYSCAINRQMENVIVYYFRKMETELFSAPVERKAKQLKLDNNKIPGRAFECHSHIFTRSKNWAQPFFFCFRSSIM